MAASMLNFVRILGVHRVTPNIVRGFRNSKYTMGAHDAEFEQAKQRSTSMKDDPGNEVKLQMYALFKQATVGKCDVQKPGVMDFVGKAKWQAWHGLDEMSQDEAQQKYIELVNSLSQAEGGSVKPAQETTGSTGAFNTLEVTRSEGIYKIMLNRPSKKNAITLEMYEELCEALNEAANDKETVLAVVTGAGNYYCSGNDLGNFTNIPPEGITAMAEKAGEVLQKFVGTFIEFPKPLIGLINGPAVGVSVTVLGLFDIVFASDKATFHTPFSVLGQSPEGCSSYTFPKLMGLAKASEMLLLSKKITAADAYARNLVTEVIPDDTFQKVTEQRVIAYAKLPKKSLRKSKKLIRDAERDLLHKVNKAECDLLVELWQGDECMNAIMQFFQKKPSKL